MLKIYLAGPDVFRQDAIGHFEMLKAFCDKWGFIGMAPLDNTIEISNDKLNTPEHSKAIFLANVELIKECDIILANLDPFRGACIDDGTAWEIGCGFALGKNIWGYSSHSDSSLKVVTDKMFDINQQKEYPIVEDFNNPVNLMISDSIYKSGGNICKTFEDCLKDMHQKFHVDDLNKLAGDKDFIEYLMIRNLKHAVIVAQEFQKGAELRDNEKRLHYKLKERYNCWIEDLPVIKTLNIQINKGIYCHPIFNSTEIFAKYAQAFFDLDIKSDYMYYNEIKYQIIAELRERKIDDILKD